MTKEVARAAGSTGEEHLDTRKQAILKAVCTEHIARAEPVGSELLASQYPLGVRSATLRNEMAEMTDLGYLRQPHTSAGRVPSDRGYRFYVDRLMPTDPLPLRTRALMRDLRKALHEEVDAILREACRVVAELTRYTSVATPPIVSASRIESVRLLSLSRHKLLVILVMESGRVEHRMLELEAAVSARDLDLLQGAVDSTFAGRKCGELPATGFPHDTPRRLSALLEKVDSAVRDALVPRGSNDMVVQGESNVLREPEFHDIERLDRLMELLHSRRAVSRLINGVEREGSAGHVLVVIGSETGYEPAREYSFVAARYSIGNQYAGAIGVFGPTRMRYSQTVPVVETVAHHVSEMLTALAGA